MSDQLVTCRYLGPKIDDLLVPGGIYIIKKVGAFPRIQDRNGTLYYVDPKFYELVDAWGEPLNENSVTSFLGGLTNRLTVVK